MDKGITLQRFADDLAEWSDQTFVGQTVDGKLAHLAKEVAELRDNPADKMEFADCFMLLVDAWRLEHGHTDGLLLASRMKLEICKHREWGKPNADGSVEHVRGPKDYTTETGDHIVEYPTVRADQADREGQ